MRRIDEGARHFAARGCTCGLAALRAALENFDAS